jgi:predicted TIM-barrel fold metal-dependent hydrolase
MATLGELRARVLPPCPALDVHVHPLSCFSPYRIESVEQDVRCLREAAQRSGVTKVCVFSLHPTCPREPTVAQCQEANDYVLRMRDLAPDFFLPFCYVNPMYPGESVVEIRRCVGEEGMVGVKLWVSRRATDPGLDPIVGESVAQDVPILQHAWRKTTGNLAGESTPGDVAHLARRHPRARIIMAHLNGCNPRGIEEVADCPNIFIDTSGGDPERGVVELAVARLGARRVLYGSDAPIRHFGVSLAKVLGAELSDSVRRELLWNNAARLLPARAGVGVI